MFSVVNLSLDTDDCLFQLVYFLKWLVKWSVCYLQIVDCIYKPAENVQRLADLS